MIDIQAGDNVVCVDLRPDWFGHVPSKIVLGRRYRVRKVVPGPDGIFLRFAGHPDTPGTFGIRACRFRKVSPKSASKHIEGLKKLPVRAREMEEL